jgi:hypothetical protein
MTRGPQVCRTAAIGNAGQSPSVRGLSGRYACPAPVRGAGSTGRNATDALIDRVPSLDVGKTTLTVCSAPGTEGGPAEIERGPEPR